MPNELVRGLRPLLAVRLALVQRYGKAFLVADLEWVLLQIWRTAELVEVVLCFVFEGSVVIVGSSIVSLRVVLERVAEFLAQFVLVCADVVVSVVEEPGIDVQHHQAALVRSAE